MSFRRLFTLRIFNSPMVVVLFYKQFGNFATNLGYFPKKTLPRLRESVGIALCKKNSYFRVHISQSPHRVTALATKERSWKSEVKPSLS